MRRASAAIAGLSVSWALQLICGAPSAALTLGFYVKGTDRAGNARYCGRRIDLQGLDCVIPHHQQRVD